MAFVVNDRVKETTTTTGTGDITFAGAVTGFESFGTGIGNSNTTYYCITLPGTAEFEVGLGTLSADSSTMARTTIISSSNSDSAVNFSAGTKDVFCTLPASKAILKDNGDDARLGTDEKLIFGDSSELEIFADSSNSRFESTQSIAIKGNPAVLLTNNSSQNVVSVQGDVAHLHYAGATKLVTTSSGIDVTGTVVSDGLTVDTNTLYVDSTNNKVGIGLTNPNDLNSVANNLVIGDGTTQKGLTIYSGTTGSGNLFFADGTTGDAEYRGYLEYIHTSDQFTLGQAGLVRFRINSTESVFNESSYDHDFRVESNNNTHALFVDGGNDIVFFNKSADGVNNTGLQFNGGSSNYLAVTRDGGNPLFLNRKTSDGDIAVFRKDNTTIGTIGTVSSGNLVLEGNTSLRLHTDGQERLILDSSECIFNNASYDQDFRVETNTNTHGLFVDAGGNTVVIGKTALDNSTAGYGFGIGSYATFVTNGTRTLLLNRLTSAGEIINFRSSNSEIGTIGTLNNDIYIGTGDTTLSFSDGTDCINPTGTNGAQRSDLVSLGDSNNRFKDAHFSGTVNTGAITATGVANLNGNLNTDSSSAVRFNTNSNSNPVVFRRTTSDNEGLSIGVDDNYAQIKSRQDENYGRFNFVGDYAGTTKSYLAFEPSAVVFNEDSTDTDFRVESDNNTHALFVDGGNNRVGILNSSPTQALDVTGTVKATAFQGDGSSLTNLPSSGNTAFFFINWQGGGTTIRGSDGVSSLSRNGTGDYTINFSTTRSSSNYTALGTGGTPSSDGEPIWTQSISTSSWRCWTKHGGGPLQDRTYHMAIGFD